MGVELLTISKYLFHSESVRVIKDYNTLVSLIFVLCYYYVFVYRRYQRSHNVYSSSKLLNIENILFVT